MVFQITTSKKRTLTGCTDDVFKILNPVFIVGDFRIPGGGGDFFINLVRIEVLSGNMVKTSTCRSFIRKLVKTSTCRGFIRNWVKTSM